MRRLAVDYAFEYTALAPFFAGNPSDPGAWASAIARAQAHRRPRAAIVAMLEAQQARRDSPPAARAAVAALADPSTVAIVTGQQAGLFGGPLFTLLKAVTTIRLSARLSREHGVKAVPVFWIDAEDHDWDEIAGCGVLASDQTLRACSGARSRRRRRTHHRVAALHRRHRRRPGRADGHSAGHGVHGRLARRPARRLSAGTRGGRGVWPIHRPRARPARAGRLRRVGPGRQAVCGAHLPSRARAGRLRRRAWRRPPAPNWSPAATTCR